MSALTKFPTGTIVLCGFCGVEMAIDAVLVFNGGIGFDLACGHRNPYCDVCEIPVRDISSLPGEINPDCGLCSSK